MEARTLTYVINGKPLLCYSNIPPSVYVYACAAQGVVLTFTKHVVGRENVNFQLDQINLASQMLGLSLKQNELSNYVSLIEWCPDRRGNIFRISDNGKSFDTGSTYISWNSIISRNSVSTGVHYVEAELKKTSVKKKKNNNNQQIKF